MFYDQTNICKLNASPEIKLYTLYCPPQKKVRVCFPAPYFAAFNPINFMHAHLHQTVNTVFVTALRALVTCSIGGASLRRTKNGSRKHRSASVALICQPCCAMLCARSPALTVSIDAWNVTDMIAFATGLNRTCPLRPFHSSLAKPLSINDFEFGLFGEIRCWHTIHHNWHMWDLALFLYFTTSKTKIKQNHAPFCLSHFFNGSGKCSPLNSVKLSVCVCVCARTRVCSLWCGSPFPFSLFVFVIHKFKKLFT